jgi:hypothetical protein
MVALAVVLTVVVLLLGLLVAGLLRSHADILKALHDLGAGVGDPAAPGPGGVPHHDVRLLATARGATGRDGAPGLVAMGPPLPPERDTASAPAVAGVTPTGDALAVAVSGHDHLTLLAFLSSGCATCAAFWQAFEDPRRTGLPADVRLVVVTKGPEMEIPGEVRARARPGLAVVMSTEAWGDYEVPGSPFFVLVDGTTGRRVGEGVAHRFEQVAELVRRARVDARSFETAVRDGSGRSDDPDDPDGLDGLDGRHGGVGLDGPRREAANDQVLAAAGILPGDPSLYPRSLADVFPPAGPPGAARGTGDGG